MIRGTVNASLEATFRLTVHGPNGKRRVRAVLDTGYNGWLTLPSAIIAELNLTWQEQGDAILGDGRQIVFDVFKGHVVWDRRKRFIQIDEAETTPLIGTALLADQQLTADFHSRGKVTITPIHVNP